MRQRARLHCLLIAALTAIALTPPAAAYATTGSGWDGPGKGSVTLTYYFGTLANSSGLAEADVKTALIAAMDAWADEAAITFVETSTPALSSSIDFHFGHGSVSGDSFSSSAIAHAYTPGPGAVAGDVHFNDFYKFEIGDASGSKFDLTLIAVHEIGHSLGMLHSAGSVMKSSVSAGESYTALTADDIAGITSLYAEATTVPEPGSLALVGIGALGLLLRRRRRGPGDTPADMPRP